MSQTTSVIEQTPIKPTVLVTGATGLLGNNLVRHLVQSGYQVRALVRSKAKAERYLADLPVELVVGDMRDVAGFRAALTDCFAVFHTAAYFREYYQPGDHAAAMAAINVEGTLQLIQAADDAGVSWFMHTSSAGAVGSGPAHTPGDEDSPPSAEQLKNGYLRSKVAGDRRIRAFVPASAMRVVEFLPGWMWGPGDAAPTAAGQLLLDFVARKIPAVPDGGLNMVDARDVARCMVEAIGKAQHGGRYIVAGRYHELSEVLPMLQRITGVAAPTLRLPFFLVLAVAWLQTLISRITGRPLLVSPDGVKLMRSRHRVSSERAVRELGATFRPFEATLRDVHAWYLQDGRIAAPEAAPGRLTHSHG